MHIIHTKHVLCLCRNIMAIECARGCTRIWAEPACFVVCSGFSGVCYFLYYDSRSGPYCQEDVLQQTLTRSSSVTARISNSAASMSAWWSIVQCILSLAQEHSLERLLLCCSSLPYKYIQSPASHTSSHLHIVTPVLFVTCSVIDIPYSGIY